MLTSPRIRNIILAEDDPDDALFFKLALEELSIPIHIQHASDGQKLTDLLQEVIPDLLFIDIHMPCKDGIACITEIRSDSRYDHMPIIVVSSSDFDFTIQNAHRTGADLFITKTVSISDLSARLQTIFDIDWSMQTKPRALADFVVR